MKIDDPSVEENLAELSSSLAKTSDPHLIQAFLHCLLTPAEAADIAARWALVKALDKKVPQREIAKGLGLSLCKITRGSRELKKPGSAFRRVLALFRESGGDSPEAGGVAGGYPPLRGEAENPEGSERGGRPPPLRGSKGRSFGDVL